jgi:hypothetical protein
LRNLRVPSSSYANLGGSVTGHNQRDEGGHESRKLDCLFSTVYLFSLRKVLDAIIGRGCASRSACFHSTIASLSGRAKLYATKSSPFGSPL